jgi:hypothetical protein
MLKKNKSSGASGYGRAAGKSAINEALMRRIFPSWKSRFQSAAHKVRSIEQEEFERKMLISAPSDLPE